MNNSISWRKIVKIYFRRAHELGDFGTVEVLEGVLLDREDLGYHLFSVLEDDTLVRGMEHLIDAK